MNNPVLAPAPPPLLHLVPRGVRVELVLQFLVKEHDIAKPEDTSEFVFGTQVDFSNYLVSFLDHHPQAGTAELGGGDRGRDDFFVKSRLDP